MTSVNESKKELFNERKIVKVSYQPRDKILWDTEFMSSGLKSSMFDTLKLDFNIVIKDIAPNNISLSEYPFDIYLRTYAGKMFRVLGMKSYRLKRHSFNVTTFLKKTGANTFSHTDLIPVRGNIKFKVVLVPKKRKKENPVQKWESVTLESFVCVATIKVFVIKNEFNSKFKLINDLKKENKFLLDLLKKNDIIVEEAIIDGLNTDEQLEILQNQREELNDSVEENIASEIQNDLLALENNTSVARTENKMSKPRVKSGKRVVVVGGGPRKTNI